MQTMNERPTPETDAMIETDAHRIEEYSTPLTAYLRMRELARTLERERDEAREATEKAKAYKRVLKQDNAKLRRERDEALLFNMRASRDASLYASMLHEKLDAERALADRLAGVLFGCTARDQNDAYDAWKEARK